MEEPKIKVGIMSAAEVKFILDGNFHVNGEGATGNQIATTDGNTIAWNGKEYNELLFQPENESEASFWLEDVTIGVNFHWERKENQRFKGALKLIIEHGKITPVNILGVEDYLLSVISSEMSATASLELSFAQVRSVVENSPLPIEIIVHGAIESMISDHNIAKLYLPDYDEFATPDKLNRHYALEDEAGEIHSLRVDQFKRWHIFFGKDLCLLPYVEKFFGAASLRIEAQNYSPEVTAQVVKLYRDALDGKLSDKWKMVSGQRKLGAGIYRFKQSKNSLQLSS